jgi:hypothetical protein
MRTLPKFIKEWFKDWFGLMGCAIFTFVGIYAAATEKSSAWVVWASAVAGAAMFFVASFQAWKRQYAANQILQERVTRLEVAVRGGEPICDPSTLHCQQQISTPTGSTVGKYSTEFIISRFAGATGREVQVEFTWPVTHVMPVATEATWPHSIEARENSGIIHWQTRSLYGGTITLPQAPTERTILKLYVSSDETLQLRSVSVSGPA